MGGEGFGHLDESVSQEPKKLLDTTKPQEQGAKVLPEDQEKEQKRKEDFEKIVHGAAQKCLSQCQTENQAIARIPDLETEIKKGVQSNELVRRAVITMSLFWSPPGQGSGVHFKIVSGAGKVDIKPY